MTTRHKLWLLWLTASTLLAATLGFAMTRGVDRELFMPGPLSPGHHQLEERCDLCHGEGFSGPEVMQENCQRCHGEVRVKPFDSHPAAKFKDPRNTDRLSEIDALHCTTCHLEHRPEITAANGVTQPADFCVHCHADVAEERPSHQGMGFETCNNAGCHNFHNNRALYTDFLIKHLDEPEQLPRPFVPEREFAGILDEIMDYPREAYPVRTLASQDMDAPLPVRAGLERDWLETAHSRSGVNCSACHSEPGEGSNTARWTNHPGQDNCRQCHALEVKHFGLGKHGMRTGQGLSAMKPAGAQLPMQQEATDRQLKCDSCHPAHRFDTRSAAVDSCLECHNDEHSLAYKDSAHFRLWQKELSGEDAAGSGVSCATCHMPRRNVDVSDWLARITVVHNQSANLSPNEKMLRDSCLHCHGLEFALNALADKTLITANFTGRPAVQLETMKLAREEHERFLKETEGMEE